MNNNEVRNLRCHSLHVLQKNSFKQYVGGKLRTGFTSIAINFLDLEGNVTSVARVVIN